MGLICLLENLLYFLGVRGILICNVTLAEGPFCWPRDWRAQLRPIQRPLEIPLPVVETGALCELQGENLRVFLGNADIDLSGSHGESIIVSREHARSLILGFYRLAVSVSVA